MNTNRRDKPANNTFKAITAMAVLVIILIGVGAMYLGASEDQIEGKFNGNRVRQGTLVANAVDYFHCSNCNTLVPCPISSSQNGLTCPACPSCGLSMNLLQGQQAGMQRFGEANFNVVGGFRPGSGMGGGLGLGSGGYIACPDCGDTMPHQRGVPCYTVHCPKCQTTMVRPLPGNVRNPQASIAGTAPAITKDAAMPHRYRGVCSKCHTILN